jgi:hypothetical protein
MLAYYLDNSNNFTIRTQDTASVTSSFTMSYQDMYTLTNATMSLTEPTFTSYENLFAFTGSISGAYSGQGLRMTLFNGETEIWNGSLEVFQSQSFDKSTYKTQITNYKSHVSTNEYIIMN